MSMYNDQSGPRITINREDIQDVLDETAGVDPEVIIIQRAGIHPPALDKFASELLTRLGLPDNLINHAAVNFSFTLGVMSGQYRELRAMENPN